MVKYEKSSPPALTVIVAFATVYIVWGSTYFFIHKAIQGFPPFMLGAVRFIAAGLIMLLWCLYKGKTVFNRKQIKTAIITGFLLLFIGNGAVIWVEQFLPSALVAILVSAAPIWFVLLDKPKWVENLRSSSTITGLLIGFAGVILLFYEKILSSMTANDSTRQVGSLALLLLGSIAWSGGSLYSKYNSKGGSTTVNSTWQMIAAGLVFLLASLMRGEHEQFQVASVSAEAWFSILYLIFFGSIAAYGAYVWLLDVCPATQVSTYAYVNPVIAVLLGVFFAQESITFLQLLGLLVILASVLLINLSNYRKERKGALS